MTGTDWHLRKEITVGNLLASISAIAVMITAYYNLDSRVQVNSASIIANKDAIVLERQDRKDGYKQIQSELADIKSLLLEIYKSKQ